MCNVIRVITHPKTYIYQPFVASIDDNHWNYIFRWKYELLLIVLINQKIRYYFWKQILICQDIYLRMIFPLHYLIFFKFCLKKQLKIPFFFLLRKLNSFKDEIWWTKNVILKLTLYKIQICFLKSNWVTRLICTIGKKEECYDRKALRIHKP